MKKLLAVLLAGSSLMAFADADLYIGGGAGAAWNNVNTGGFTFRLNGGYNFNDYLAVELGTTNVAQSGSAALNQNMQFWDLSVKGTLPLADSFGLFGQVGGAYGIPGVVAAPSNGANGTTNPGNASEEAFNSTTNQDRWDMLAGAGVQFNLTKKTAFTLGDYYYFGSTNVQGNTNVLLAGIKYNF
jgi:hypothetical protein